MLEKVAITALDVLAWVMLLTGIGGAVNVMLTQPSPLVWLWLVGGVLGWALLVIIVTVVDRFLWYTSSKRP